MSEKSRVWTDTNDRRIKKRGDWFWARFKKRGTVVEESLKTQSFTTAKRLADEIENNILLGVDWRKEHELFETAWPEFLTDKAQGNKTKIARERTLKDYVWFGEKYYLPHFKSFRMTEIDDPAWEQFVAKIRKDSPDMQFFNLRKHLMGFLSWAKRKGKIREVPSLFDPDGKAKAAKEHAGPGRAFSVEELGKLRAAASEQSEGFYAFMLMAQFMGMRPSEITQLRIDRVDLDKGIISLRKADTKTHRARLVPIHPAAIDALRGQINASKRDGSEFLFPNHRDKSRPMDHTGFKRHWAAVSRRTGLEGRIYDFRHSFITHALAAGANPVVIAEMTGTSIAIIQKHYLHLQPADLSRELSKVTL